MASITMYSTGACPYCTRAEQFLASKGVTAIEKVRIDLDPARRAEVTDAASAAELMLADPTLVKRPVLEHADGIVVGFSETVYDSLFGAEPGAPT